MDTIKVKFPFNKELSKKTYSILNFMYVKFIKPNFRVKKVPELTTRVWIKDNKLLFKVELDLDTVHVKDREEIDNYLNKLKNEMEV